MIRMQAATTRRRSRHEPVPPVRPVRGFMLGLGMSGALWGLLALAAYRFLT